MNYKSIDKFPSNSVIILLIIGITLGFNVFGSVITIISINLGIGIEPKLIQAVSQIIFLFGLTIIISHIIPLRFKQIFRLEENIRFKYIFYGIIGLFFLNLFNTGFVSLQEHLIPESLMGIYHEYIELMDSIYDKMLKGTDVYDFFLAIIIGAIIPSISEEFLFRGFGQRSLEENNSIYFSVFTTGTIFGLIHFNLINLFPLILIGIFLGFLAHYSKNILVPVFIHFLNNAVSILFFYIGEPEILNDDNTLPLTLSIILSIVGLLGVLSIIIILIRSEN
ncbi:MAG: type II CAAX endopeptidase family protein [Candidatus Kapaibacterium sp.]|nr:CPBP family intramembrane metalloprotease [Ignavibacteriota bacterium]MCB9220650.1 CPBP family intramembrane metalloprotease [Ignavibacteria bacterium]